MTYDPYRNATRPDDPHQGYHRDLEGGSGAGVLLGALLLLAIGGFIYFFGTGDNSNVATNDMRPPITQRSTTGSAPPAETTGSGSSERSSSSNPASPDQSRPQH